MYMYMYLYSLHAGFHTEGGTWDSPTPRIYKNIIVYNHYNQQQ